MSPTRDDPATRRAAELSRGTNQIGVRLYNERLVLSLIRRNGSLPKADIARRTGLSAQTISVIMRQLEADGLVVKGDPQRGRVGQPSVPFALDPNGAFALGLKIGRRSSDLVLLDFVGAVRWEERLTHRYPTPAGILDFVRDAIPRLTTTLSQRKQTRIAGLGIAAPFELWNWTEEVGAPPAALNEWRDFDVAEAFAAVSPWPVSLCNDATAACAAELTLGQGTRYPDFLYIFIGSFIGGGVVLDGRLYPGRTGNAGAIGSMPLARAAANGHPTQQLIRCASMWVLENKLLAAGRDASMLWRSPDDWEDVGPQLDEWIEEVASSLAVAITSAVAVIDFEAVIIDGACPVEVRARIVARTRACIDRIDRQGLSEVTLVEGSIGSGARAIGGACLCLLDKFARDQDVLLKENAQP